MDPSDTGRAPRRGLARRGSALVLVSEQRAAFACTLVLQEFDLNVDAGVDGSAALRWLRRARYDVVVAGGPGLGTAEFARLIRHAAPATRIVLLPTGQGVPVDLPSNVDVLPPPLDVNALVECLGRSA